MYVAFYLAIFIVELFLLALVSKRVLGTLSNLIYKIFKSESITVYIFALLFLPGTIIHELSHLFAAGMMFVPIGEIDIFPKTQADGSIKLGSVQIGHTDPFRRLTIGVAPVIFGSLILAAVIFLSKEYVGLHGVWWVNLLILYLVFEISNTMFSSKKDMEGSLAFLGLFSLGTVVVVVGAYLLGFRIDLASIENLRLSPVENLLKTLNYYLLFPIALDLIVYLPFKLLKKVITDEQSSY